MFSTLSRAAVAVVALTTIVAGSPQLASASQQTEQDFIRAYRNTQTNRCLYVWGGANVETAGKDCNSSSNDERWEIQGANPYVMKNLATGKCLHASDQGVVTVHDCNGSANQQWSVRYEGNNRVFENVRINRCLDSNYEGRVYTEICNAGAYQRWYPY